MQLRGSQQRGRQFAGTRDEKSQALACVQDTAEGTNWPMQHGCVNRWTLHADRVVGHAAVGEVSCRVQMAQRGHACGWQSDCAEAKRRGPSRRVLLTTQCFTSTFRSDLKTAYSLVLDGLAKIRLAARKSACWRHGDRSTRPCTQAPNQSEGVDGGPLAETPAV